LSARPRPLPIAASPAPPARVSFAPAGKPEVIDGLGLAVAPGFIDLHTPGDTALTRPASRANLRYLLTEVTTVVTGNCGTSPADVAAYLKK
jgi:N-acyl-D-amino-acid deacylase